MQIRPLVMTAMVAVALAGCAQTGASGDTISGQAGQKIGFKAPTQTALQQKVTAKAKQHGVPPRLAHAVIRVESNYNCAAKNPHSSATGVMQVLPRTARGVGVYGNLRNCDTGLEAGMRYLRIAYEKANGDWCGAATLYNRGTAARPVRSHYCRLVLARAG